MSIFHRENLVSSHLFKSSTEEPLSVFLCMQSSRPILQHSTWRGLLYQVQFFYPLKRLLSLSSFLLFRVACFFSLDYFMALLNRTLLFLADRGTSLASLLHALLFCLSSLLALFLRPTQDRLKLKEFFDVNNLSEEKWGRRHAAVRSLALFVFFKFTATILSAACPVPAGIFTPIFVCGAALGKFSFFTDLLDLIFIGLLYIERREIDRKVRDTKGVR